MPTSSISKSFVVSGEDQVEKFANAIEESFQESQKRKSLENKENEICNFLTDKEEVKKFMKDRKELKEENDARMEQKL